MQRTAAGWLLAAQNAPRISDAVLVRKE